MNLSEIPTPETDAVTFDPYPWNRNGPGRSHCPEVMYPCGDGEWVKAEYSRDLERRLTVCRDLLACINSSQIMDDQIHAKISETLTLTAPKK